MAGDWIKIEHVTPDKPEIYRMAFELGVTPEAVVGHLLRLWIWADQQSRNGHDLIGTNVTINSVSRLENFATALRNVGWLEGELDRLTFPKFDRHNGKSAKERALNTRNKRENRSRSYRDKTGTREEKRIYKEKDKKEKTKFVKPSVSDVREYCEAKGYNFDPEQFVAFYESKGWRVGNQPMKSWQSACVTWNGRDRPKPNGNGSGGNEDWRYDL